MHFLRFPCGSFFRRVLIQHDVQNNGERRCVIQRGIFKAHAAVIAPMNLQDVQSNSKIQNFRSEMLSQWDTSGY